MKTAARIPDTRQSVQAVVQKYTSASWLEVQQRSCEFDRIFKSPDPTLFKQLLDHMPPLTEAEYMKATGASALQSSSQVTASPPRLGPPSPPCFPILLSTRYVILVAINTELNQLFVTAL